LVRRETLGAWERASETRCVEHAEKRPLKHLPSMARLSIPLDAGEGFDRPAASLIGAADIPSSCHEDVVSN